MTREELFTAHLWLADHIARDFFFPTGDRQDVQQEARAALFEATRDFRTGHGTTFKSFASLVIRRRLCSAVTEARRGKHQSLTHSMRVAQNEHNEEVPILDLLEARGPDPHEQLEAREEIRRIVAGVRDLSASERRGLLAVINGDRYESIGPKKAVDNAIQRARRKLREAA